MQGKRKGYRLAPAAYLVVLLCGACAAIGTPPPALREFKTIGIVSAIGDTLTVTKAGLTGFKDNDERFPIDAWGVDDLIISEASEILSRHFEVQPVTYQRAAFATLENDQPVAVVDMLRDDPAKELIRARAAPQGLDAYVVITKSKSAYGSHGRKVTGIGIIHNAALFNAYTQVHALYVIRVIDGHSFKVIDKRPAVPLNSTDIVRLEGPSRLVDDTFLPTSSGVIGNERLKAAVIDLINRSLPTTLEQLRLVHSS
jgi:hypothetical protein